MTKPAWFSDWLETADIPKPILNVTGGSCLLQFCYYGIACDELVGMDDRLLDYRFIPFYLAL